uniref:Uncharacterized protein n=1 Tax=Arundo donax TaxID=35708 RepID=A0A0A9HR17_ARUDO
MACLLLYCNIVPNLISMLNRCAIWLILVNYECSWIQGSSSLAWKRF